MPLELMYLTNKPDIAVMAEQSGVNRIWVDLEVLGKDERQRNMNTVKSKHELKDIATIKPLLQKAKLQVRINGINHNSKDEINAVIDSGADIIMLPMFKTIKEVELFLSYINGRAKALLLLETKEAHKILNDILTLEGIDEIHIGLNDLHLSYEKLFMFELLLDGTVENICNSIKLKNIPYGFGGIARLGQGMIPAEYVIAEHYRLGSTRAILARSFCDTSSITNLDQVSKIFNLGLKEIRSYEKELVDKSEDFFKSNNILINKKIEKVVNSIIQKQLQKVI